MTNLKATLLVLAAVLMTANPSKAHFEGDEPHTCRTDPVTCWMLTYTKKDCTTNNPLDCWIGSYHNPHENAPKPALEKDWKIGVTR